jgi:hypothetical protein
MLNVIMLIVVMLNVVMLSVIMQNFVALLAFPRNIRLGWKWRTQLFNYNCKKVYSSGPAISLFQCSETGTVNLFIETIRSMIH